MSWFSKLSVSRSERGDATPLRTLSVARPCSEDWLEMRPASGGRRFCEACGKNVHDVAKMTPRQAERLAFRAAAGEEVCARVSRRADGSLVTAAPEFSAAGRRAGQVVLSAALAAGLPAAAQGVAGEPQRAPQRTAVIRGRLLRPDGSVVQAGLIRLDGEHQSLLLVADESGYFQASVEPGIYTIGMQTGPEEGLTLAAVTLHEGEQRLESLRTQPGHPDAADAVISSGGALVANVSWSWRARLRHPIWYTKALLRRLG